MTLSGLEQLALCCCPRRAKALKDSLMETSSVTRAGNTSFYSSRILKLILSDNKESTGALYLGMVPRRLNAGPRIWPGTRGPLDETKQCAEVT